MTACGAPAAAVADLVISTSTCMADLQDVVRRSMRLRPRATNLRDVQEAVLTGVSDTGASNDVVLDDHYADEALAASGICRFCPG